MWDGVYLLKGLNMSVLMKCNKIISKKTEKKLRQICLGIYLCVLF